MTNELYLKQLGAKIRKARRERGISLERLAKMCMFDYTNLSAVECGKKNTRILTIKTIAGALEMDVKDLL
jgi:transcriptional regulator with XRE-family HTH domain